MTRAASPSGLSGRRAASVWGLEARIASKALLAVVDGTRPVYKVSTTMEAPCVWYRRTCW